MRCTNCGTNSPDGNRFCGQCGSPLPRRSERSAISEAPAGPVLNSFRDDVERQRSELREIRQQQTGAEASPSIGTPPLSKLATANSTFGPPDSSPDREPAKPWFSPPRGASLASTPISGPSFLGLSDPDPEEHSDLTYLYEEDGPPSHARQWVVALIAITFVGLMVYEWRQNPGWHATMVGWAQQAWPQRKAASASQPLPPLPPSASPSAQTPIPSTTTAAAGAGSKQSKPLPEEDVKGTGDNPNGADIATSASQHSVAATKLQTSPKSSARKNSEGRAAPVDVPSGERNEPENTLVTKAEGYLYGRGGMPKNCDQALVYLRTAADRGSAMARSKLGGLYATGNCVPLDRARAYNWFTRAREAGDHNIWIERNLSMLWNEMTPEEKARAAR